MRFISIPADGASWREPLVYRFSTEGDVPEDVSVDIIDSTSGSLFGSLMLYGVVKGEVDIAPYIAKSVSLSPTWSTRPLSIMRSTSAKRVTVCINGVESVERLFFRSQFDTTKPCALSTMVDYQVVEYGDSVRLTLYGKAHVAVKMLYGSGTMTQLQSSTQTSGYPTEVIFSTKRMAVGDVVELEATLDSQVVQSFRYRVVERGAASRALLWYNHRGGIERYAFPHCLKLGYGVGVQSVEGVNRLKLRSVNGWVRSRLCSRCESSEEVERIAEVLLSPVVFADREDSVTVVELESREVAFDAKGQLHTISLDISEEWKGGAL
ncbi:MAG: hypothetical protein J6V26_00140 [Alistipes sp.]|nr:hypothetical protein [Alistipes sp.]